MYHGSTNPALLQATRANLWGQGGLASAVPTHLVCGGWLGLDRQAQCLCLGRPGCQHLDLQLLCLGLSCGHIHVFKLVQVATPDLDLQGWYGAQERVGMSRKHREEQDGGAGGKGGGSCWVAKQRQCQTILYTLTCRDGAGKSGQSMHGCAHKEWEEGSCPAGVCAWGAPHRASFWFCAQRLVTLHDTARAAELAT